MKKFDFRILLGVILSVILAMGIVACGGGYDDPADEYYKNDANAKVLISPTELKAWIDAGYKTESGQKVVILDTTRWGGVDANSNSNIDAGEYTLDHANYIPGAIHPPMLNLANGDGQGWGMNRSDGVMYGVGNEVYDGATMDAILQATGIDKDTVIVLTNNESWATSIPHQATRPYWVFYYWGFSKANLKLLNGGNTGYADLIGAGNMDTEASTPMLRSSFSVKDLPGNRIDLVRAPIGEVYDRAIAGDFENGKAVIMNTMGVGSTYATDGDKTSSGTNFNGKIRGAKILGNGLGATLATAALGKASGSYWIFKEPTDTPVLFADSNDASGASILPANKQARIIVHCGSGQSTTPYWFYLTFVLGYTNVAVYDGSTGEWNTATVSHTDGSLAADYLKVSGPPAVAANKWIRWDGSKWVNKEGTEITGIVSETTVKYDAAKASDFVSFETTAASSANVDTSYTGNAREINKEDKDYQNGMSAGDDGAFIGGATGGC
jgi:3-mercaptopyruvate sulfurtransferase SseA